MRFLLFLFFALIAAPAFAAQATSAKQAYIIDYETGQVLLEKNAEERMPTSSMSKVMTMYMVFEALKGGAITLDTKYNVSEKAWGKGGSKMFVELGKDIKVSDLIRGVIVQSGNDATIVLAEGLSGDEDRFAKAMTEKAKEIGMKNSNFMNASGWPDPDHYSTAHDLAMMSNRIINDFPEYYYFYSETEFTYNAIKQPNRNPLLYRNIGADGLKTGHTEIGGYGLIGTAKNEDRRVIMVLNGLASEAERADEGTRLISWALNNFENVTLAKKDDEITKARVVMGKSDAVTLVVGQDIRMTIPKLDKDKITFKASYNTPLIAPVTQGQEVGVLTISAPDEEDVMVPLYAKENVESLGFFKKTWTKFEQAFFGALK